MGWNTISTDQIILPSGATTGARIVMGTEIPPELQAFAALNGVVFSAVIVSYFGTPDDSYRWMATGSWPVTGPTYFAGTWDSVNGVYMTDKVFVDTAGPGQIAWQVGSTLFNTFPLEVDFLRADVTVQNDTLGEGVLITANPGGPGGQVWYYTGDAAETWQSANMLAGWNNIVTSFRRVASPPDTVQLTLRATPGTRTDGTVIFQLPVGYRPSWDQDHTITTTVAGTSPRIHIDSATGNVSVIGIGLTTLISESTILIPLV